MHPAAPFVRTVGRLLLLSGLIALSSDILLAYAVNFNFDAFANPALIFSTLTPAQIQFFHWGMITDIWGYYLLFVPAVLLLLELSSSPWRKLVTVSGVAYALIGSIGAAILAATGTHFLQQYLVADAAAQPAIADRFMLVYNIVNNGMWNLLEMGLFGVFLFGAARVIRGMGRSLYALTLLLAACAILDTIANTFGVSQPAEVSLDLYLALYPAWAIWLGLAWMQATDSK